MDARECEAQAAALKLLQAQVLQVGWLKPRMLGDADQHARADFFLLVECPDVIRILRLAMTKLDV
jgi:hypothetical protein